mgnify:CR=1 FL=1
MKTLILILSAIFLSSCVATPSALGTAAAVAAKPTQDSLKSYFAFEKATDENGEKVTLDEESTSNEFVVVVNDCAQKSIDQYTEDFISTSADDAVNDASKAALGAAAAPALGGALLAPVAVFAAPAALLYTGYQAIDTASKIAERFESEKEYALTMQQCISELGYKVDFKELTQ